MVETRNQEKTMLELVEEIRTGNQLKIRVVLVYITFWDLNNNSYYNFISYIVYIVSKFESAITFEVC